MDPPGTNHLLTRHFDPMFAGGRRLIGLAAITRVQRTGHNRQKTDDQQPGTASPPAEVRAPDTPPTGQFVLVMNSFAHWVIPPPGMIDHAGSAHSLISKA
jgi:hypothetical protein